MIPAFFYGWLTVALAVVPRNLEISKFFQGASFLTRLLFLCFVFGAGGRAQATTWWLRRGTFGARTASWTTLSRPWAASRLFTSTSTAASGPAFLGAAGSAATATIFTTCLGWRSFQSSLVLDFLTSRTPGFLTFLFLYFDLSPWFHWRALCALLCNWWCAAALLWTRLRSTPRFWLAARATSTLRSASWPWPRFRTRTTLLRSWTWAQCCPLILSSLL